MGSFSGLLSGCMDASRFGEVPEGTSTHDLKERAAIAAMRAAQHEAAGHTALARTWRRAAERLRDELEHRLKPLGELPELGLSTGGQVLVGAAVLAGAGFIYKSLKADHPNVPAY